MGKCRNHPNEDTTYLCMKHNVYMCYACLKCPDDQVHCKFRSSCPIWFMDKRNGKKLDAPVETQTDGDYTVTIQPYNKKTIARQGQTLLEVVQQADIPLNASCNGKGVCGTCKLVVESGKADTRPTPFLTDKEMEKGYVLACQATVQSDLVVAVPEENIKKRLQVAGSGREATKKLKGLIKDISPMLSNYALELDPPTLADSVSDLDRLYRGLNQKGLRTDCMEAGLSIVQDLSNILREDHFHITTSIIKKRCSYEIAHVAPGKNHVASLGLAVDVGTTSVVVYLVDMKTGSVLSATSGHNRQAACGDDVINRIICAEKDGVKKLSNMVLATINGLINEVIDGAGADKHGIDNVVVSGNTTMTHLLLKIEPKTIRREPYIPTISSFPILKAKEVGLKINPAAAVFIMPCPAGYVGGDIVSGLLYTKLHKQKSLSLFIDIGTNGEIALGNKDWLMVASCSAGPAFEGGGVRWGMRAEEGAIEKLSIDRKTGDPDITVVGGQLPRGICGTGMIDLMSELFLLGMIQPNGKFQLKKDHPRFTQDNDEPAYIVVFSDQTSVGKDIIFTESDIDNIIRSKAAIYAGFTVLLNQAGLDFSDVKEVVITGGFGQFLDLEKAVIIGLLPDIDRSKFKYLGNSSISGAYLALLSESYRKEALDLSSAMTYIDFSSNNQFMSEFTSALFLPHTDIGDFPNVEKAVAKRKPN